ncbi:hypothetical protein [Nocardiopsis ganjiahuensis]|nr:hypothetical protein [Nocardiopsis ganjiahuensis]
MENGPRHFQEMVPMRPTPLFFICRQGVLEHGALLERVEAGVA